MRCARAWASLPGLGGDVSNSFRRSNGSLSNYSPQRRRAVKGAGSAGLSARTLRVRDRNEGGNRSPDGAVSPDLEGSPNSALKLYPIEETRSSNGAPAHCSVCPPSTGRGCGTGSASPLLSPCRSRRGLWRARRWPNLASKGELLRVVERLVAEDEHGEAVAVHRRFDRAGLRGAERLAEVQALHLGGEDGCSGVSGRPGSPFTADEVSCLPAIASFPCSRQALPARLRPLFAPSAL